MNSFLEVLPVLLYLFGIVLIIVFTVVGFKLIKVLDRADDILRDLERKTQSLDSVFNVVDAFSNSFTTVNLKIADFATRFVTGIYNKYKSEGEEE